MATPARIQPKQASLAATGIACLVGAVACVLIGSIYAGRTSGWLQFALSVFSAATVCAVGASALAYAAHQQYMVKKNLFSDHDLCGTVEYDYRMTRQWTVVTNAADVVKNECTTATEQVNYSVDYNCSNRSQDAAKNDNYDVGSVADSSSSA